MKHSFFQRALEGNNKWWTFLAGMLMISGGFTLGQMPITILLIYKMGMMVSENPDSILEINERLLAYDFAYFGLGSNLSFFLILLSFVGGIFFVFLTVTKIHKRAFISIITPSKKINWGKIGFGFAVWFLMSFAIEGLSLYMDPENYVWTFNLKAFIPLLLMCIFILPLQTSFEEVFMRGYLMQGIPLHPNTILLCIFVMGGLMHVSTMVQDPVNALIALGIYAGLAVIIGVLFYQEKKGRIKLGLYTLVRKPITPLIITSLMFGLMHGMNPEIAEFGFGKMMVFYIGMGLFLGLLTVMDESLELALGVHFANNFFGALFVSFDGSALQTPTLLRSLEMNTDYMLVGWFGMVSVFMAAAYFKYRWKNWGKLFQTIQYDTTDANVEDIAFLENEVSLAEAPLNNN
jgi:membrane protease YdiL (CAAX protease family)